MLKFVRVFRGVIRESSYTILPGILCAIANSLLVLLVPRMAGSVVAELPLVNWMSAVGLAAVLVGQAVLGFLATYLLGWAAARSVIELRQSLFERLMLAPIAFHDRNWSARQVNVLTADTAYIEQSLNTVLPVVVQHLPIVLFSLLFLIRDDLKLTMTLILVGAPLLVIVSLTGRALRHYAHQGQLFLADLAVIAQESIFHVRDIKGLAKEPFFLKRFNIKSEELFDLKRRRVRWDATLEGSLPAGAITIGIVAIWVIQTQLASGEIVIDQLVSFSAYLVILSSSLRLLMKAYAGAESLRGAGERVAYLYYGIGEAEKQPGKVVQPGGAVTIEDLTFIYPENRGGVTNINLDIMPGEVLALLGPNGAGKSTLAHLLLRFYRPQAGRIRLNGVAAEEVDLTYWRRQCALVTRDPAIFSLSVGENIGLGRACARQDEIETAARAVGLHDFICTLPGRYAARVGEGGVLLSAGQRQRLMLARAFIQNPSIIILDEATHSLDRESEKAFISAFRRWLGDRTAIIITHHIDPEWPITRIVQMQAGRIVSNMPAASWQPMPDT